MSETIQKVSFGPSGGLLSDLRKGVALRLDQPNIRERARRKLHRKAVYILTWWAISYTLLLLSTNWQQIVVCGASLVLASNAAAFNIMHDGNHGSFSTSRWLNRLAGFVMELLGGSSFIWDVKHNTAHHTYPNLVGYDEDIDLPPLARVASTQPYRPYYKWQHLYLWPLYGLVTLRWQLWGDTVHIITRRVSRFELTGLNTREVLAYAFGKLLSIGWVFALPLALHWSWHGAAMFVVTYLVLSWAFSFVMVVTFQLAHCVDEALFSSPEDADGHGKLPNSWARQQVLATTDFCTDNRVISWFAGGLNFQVIHHLFPHEPHVLYPEIVRAVRDVCGQHSVPYRHQPTLRAALAAHYRHLYAMGRQPQG